MKSEFLTTLHTGSLHQYSFQFVQEHIPFIKSILSLLQHDTTTCACIVTSASKMRAIEFCAHSVEPLSSFIKGQFEYSDSIRMLHCLYHQVSILAQSQLGMYGLDIHDIYVINSSIFVYIQSTFIKQLSSNHSFQFYSPIYRDSPTSFFAPEIIGLEKLPATILSTCFYYSLGALAVYCLFKKRVDINNVKTIVSSISGTKLYWMLLKALNTDCERRVLLFF